MINDTTSQPTDWPAINADPPIVTLLMQQNAALIKQVAALQAAKTDTTQGA